MFKDKPPAICIPITHASLPILKAGDDLLMTREGDAL